ncbi:MAG TPA: AAA domain-containing protein, partial [Gemmataceae bacterium]|nr:AAA domain-containing protein [Gemmataceae bacterium]
EQILTWGHDFKETIAAGGPVSLNRYLRFEEAVYLPGLLDQIRNEARRDQNEYGFAQLRLVLGFLHWANLKEKPPERYDSPLVLLPVRLTKTKGVRDIYTLEPQSAEAEVNPILRHYLKQLYAVELPERIDLASTPLEMLYEFLVGRIQSNEPAVTVEKIDRPRIQLIHARAQRRLDQYRRRVRLSGRGVRAFLDLDYSYDRDNFHPLGLRLFQTRIRPADTHLRAIVTESPRPRSFMTPSTESPAADKETLLYSLAEEESNPYRWEFDLCNITLGNFRYRKMSLVRDYAALLENGAWPPGLESLFSLEPRPAQQVRAEPPPLDDANPIVPWDPTQASAIAFSRSGQNYIIQGPPGTGKSQTITNLIADYVVRGKRVLFICEKRAALDVVFHRLQQAGLDGLCCLIHDSQEDKKPFIMDLKQTYERLLETQHGKMGQAGKARAEVIAAIKHELTPFERIHEAMVSYPPEAGVPLRRLLQRGVELGDGGPALTAEQKERVPPYALWHEHRGSIERLAAALQELQGDAVLARNPLRNLNPRLAAQERPLEFLHEHLPRAQKLLKTLAGQLPALGEEASLKDAAELVSHALSLQFLAERRHLALLQAKSELAKELVSVQRQYDVQAKKLLSAQTANKGWKHKLPPDEVKTALEQARTFPASIFCLLKPAWWRLRRILHRCYDFHAHTIKPTWTQVLQALQQEYEIQNARDNIESEARTRFGFAESLPAFTARIAAVRDSVSALPAHVQAWHQGVLAAANGDESVLAVARLQPVLEQLQSELAGILENGNDLSLAELQLELAAIDQALDSLPEFLPCLKELAVLPAPLVQLCRLMTVPVGELESPVARKTVEEYFRANRAVSRFTGPGRVRLADGLERAYARLHGANAAVVQESVQARFLENVRLASLPHGQLTAEQKEFKVAYNRGRRELEHEFSKTMRYKSIRDLVAGESGLVIQDLKPVWLTSPLSVSDVLPLDGGRFDLVIFDEASQVPLENAVPAIFRAAQFIVVGDEMQLPPTNFFTARLSDEDESLTLHDEGGEAVDYELSGNSFLNHAARHLPATLLGWHYRSRSEALISFSNRAFYDGRLLSVPDVHLPAAGLGDIRVRDPEDGLANVARVLDRPVSCHFLEGGIYQQRRNPAEADYIAHLVQALLEAEQGMSIGIIAFSEAQQAEIEEALRRLAAREHAFRERLEAEFEREQDGQFAGLLVKNLENIQGDERDVVILSVCYGHGPNGKMLMNFGPINQTGGERRLNVAFSRARQHMVLVASIQHHEITNDYNDGARCLKNYLRYADAVSRGDAAAAQRVLWEMSYRDIHAAAKEAPDVVKAQLAVALCERGFDVDDDVGQSSFRCDLAIRRAGDSAYRLGVIIDTDAYYQDTNLLEREVLKPKLLRAFG